MFPFLFPAASSPTNVSATAISSTSIRLTWSEPASLNGILHDYKIRLKLSSDVTYGTSVTVGKLMNYTVNSLTPFTDYEVQVKGLHFIITYNSCCNENAANYLSYESVMLI